jgi:predicted ribonuclease YlaK
MQNKNTEHFYTGYEIDLLIEEVTEAALEAIEKAAGEAAKATALAMLEREAAALREAASQQREAIRWRMEAETHLTTIGQIKKAGAKNTVLGVAMGILSGLIVGAGGTLIIGGR